MSVPTKAQVAALRWLIERERTEEIPATALWIMYRDAPGALHKTTMRECAWKRISGRNMSAMKRDGLLMFGRTTYSRSAGSHGVYYTITDAGIEAAKA